MRTRGDIAREQDPRLRIELNENKAQIVRIRDKNVNFKGLCYIYKKSVWSFYFETDIKQNPAFCP